MKNKRVPLIITLLFFSLMLSACGKKEEVVVSTPVSVSVKGQTVGSSLSVKQSLSYPGTVVADSEATITAKASGNLTGANFKVGDVVSLGQELAKIDDVSSPSFNSSNFNTNQIKQAKNAATSAEAAYNLAKSNYESLLITAVKDLRSAEIARDQAAKGQSNLDITTEESVKSAELAYETAKIATQQASSTLMNREKLAIQSAKDILTNADLTASSVVSSAGAIITNINNFTAFDINGTVSIDYRSNLGALDSTTYDVAKQAYNEAKNVYSDYQKKQPATVAEDVDNVIIVVEAVRRLTDSAKNLLDKSISSSALPASASLGLSLSGLQSAVSGYQTQINAAAGQINGMKQSLVNVDLNNTTLLDSLRQAYQLASQQEASAKQNLNNLKSGNTSQQNQAGYVANLAQNQYDNSKVKIEAQISASRTQVETAELQYNNAVMSLQSLYDAHSIIAPINGTVTKIFVADGQAVAQGQAVATISQTQNIKVQFYIEADNLKDITLGLPVAVVDDNNVSHAGVIAAVSPQADLITRRFLAEIKLEYSTGLFLGTIVTVRLDLIKTAKTAGTIILPLSAVTIGQNGNFIFIAENGLAKKVNVEIQEVLGESARIKTDLPAEAIVIVEGNRLLEEGQGIALN